MRKIVAIVAAILLLMTMTGCTMLQNRDEPVASEMPTTSTEPTPSAAPTTSPEETEVHEDTPAPAPTPTETEEPVVLRISDGCIKSQGPGKSPVYRTLIEDEGEVVLDRKVEEPARCFGGGDHLTEFQVRYEGPEVVGGYQVTEACTPTARIIAVTAAAEGEVVWTSSEPFAKDCAKGGENS